MHDPCQPGGRPFHCATGQRGLYRAAAAWLITENDEFSTSGVHRRSPAEPGNHPTQPVSGKIHKVEHSLIVTDMAGQGAGGPLIGQADDQNFGLGDNAFDVGPKQ